LILTLSLAACGQDTPTDPDEPQPTGKVTSFSLINADTNQPVEGFDPLPEVVALDLTELPSKNLNIRANTEPEAVGSVRFHLNGALQRTEDSAPYTLAGKDGADYHAWTPEPGDYTLTATPYNGAGASGDEALSVTFTVAVPPTGPDEPEPAPPSAVTSFSLIDADTNEPVAGFDPLPDGAALDLTALPTKNLNIRANTESETVGSVQFHLNGTLQNTEDSAPYTLAGKDEAGFKTWTPEPGSYTL
jgi:hypothetical protein